VFVHRGPFTSLGQVVTDVQRHLGVAV
jgi:hypothetical protein